MSMPKKLTVVAINKNEAPITESNNPNPVTILLIDELKSRRSILNRALTDFGYQVKAQLVSCENLLEEVEYHQAQIIVIGTDIPTKETIAQLVLLHKSSPRPIILFSEKHTPQVVERSIKAGVTTFVVDDIQPQRLKSIVDVAYVRFKEYQSLREELDETKNQLAQRKIIEKAKGLLMEQKTLSEDDAYKALRKMAMDKGQTLGQVSKNLIDVWELLAN